MLIHIDNIFEYIISIKHEKMIQIIITRVVL
jgi:hypothetical protein